MLLILCCRECAKEARFDTPQGYFLTRESLQIDGKLEVIENYRFNCESCSKWVEGDTKEYRKEFDTNPRHPLARFRRDLWHGPDAIQLRELRRAKERESGSNESTETTKATDSDNQ